MKTSFVVGSMNMLIFWNILNKWLQLRQGEQRQEGRIKITRVWKYFGRFCLVISKGRLDYLIVLDDSEFRGCLNWLLAVDGAGCLQTDQRLDVLAHWRKLIDIPVVIRQLIQGLVDVSCERAAEVSLDSF